jgi:hypothetical protein
MVKQQQMRWTKQGAHLLLQIRAQVINGELPAAFRRWYSGFEVEAVNPESALWVEPSVITCIA